MTSNFRDLIALTNDVATITYNGRTVRYVNERGDTYDNDSMFYVATRDAYGSPEAVIHVVAYDNDSFGSAWEAFIDSCPTIAADEVHEAYGYDTREAFEAGDKDRPLVEGYEYQDNASGTGIVDVGHNAGMYPVKREKVEFSA